MGCGGIPDAGRHWLDLPTAPPDWGDLHPLQVESLV